VSPDGDGLGGDGLGGDGLGGADGMSAAYRVAILFYYW